MHVLSAVVPPAISNREYSALTRKNLSFALLVCLLPVLSVHGRGQNMSTFSGLNTVQYRMNSTATPDPTIAVGLTDYCEHVNSGYQCWYKSGVNANQPVNFFGNTNVKSDAQPWNQNGNNNGNTPNCPTTYSPNSQMVHDNVYDVWIMEKRITSTINGHNYMCVAISNIDDFSQPSFAWFAFEYDLDNVIPKNSHGNFYYPDYPQVGLWQSSTTTVPPYTPASDQALWITYDLQDPNNGSNVMGVLLCAVDLAGLRASTASPWVNNSKTPACVIAHPLVTFTQRRSWVPANNTDTTPPISADGEMFTYMIEPPKDNKSYLTDPNHTQGVEQWTIDWSSGAPTPTELNSWDLPSTEAGGDQLGCFTASNYYDTVCIPQPSTGSTGIYIDSVADRMQQFFHYTSNGGQGSIWTSAHAIQIAPSTTLSQTEADVRVLQRNTMTPTSMFVAADFPILDPNDSTAYVFLPSVVRDKAGNLQGILGVSGSGVSQHPGLDSLSLNPATLARTSYGYIKNPMNDGDAEDTDSLNYRWGDWYSGVLDPVDGCTVWVAGEYLPTNRTSEPYWYTELASLPPVSTCAGGPVLLSNVSVNFGNQQVGVRSAALIETVTNNQSVNLNILGIAAGGDFQQTNSCNQPLQPHQSCTISIYLTPSSTGPRTQTLTISDDAPNSPQLVALAGIGASSALTVSANSLTFGNQVVNTNSSGQKVTVSNTGFVNVTINSVQASGGFAETDTCTGVTLTPSQTCTITAGFTPVVVGATTGTITINDTAAGAPHVIAMTGTGLVPVQLSGPLSYPAQNVGTSSPPATMTVTNNQNSTLTYSMSISGDYSAVGNGTSPCNGTTLASKAKCTYAVTFTPTTNGQIKGALTITYSGSTSPAYGGLSGTGQNGPSSPLSFSPASVNFGNVVLKATASKTVTVKNVSTSSITFTSITGSGSFTATPSGATPCTGTLNAGGQCSMTVKFTPLVTGSVVAGITIIDNGSISTQVQNAAGTGVLPVTLSPTTINFGTVAVGSTSAVQVVTVTNNQTTAVPINSVVPSGDFVYTSGGGVPCGASVPANSICTLGVEFAPTTTGGISGDLTFNYAAGSSPQVVALSGTGQ